MDIEAGFVPDYQPIKGKEALIKERDDIVASRKKSYSSDAARQAADKEIAPACSCGAWRR